MKKTDQIENYFDNRVLSIPCLALCAVLIIVLGFLPLLKNASEIITMVFRPAVIFLCLFIPSPYIYRANRTISLFIVYLVYLTLILFFHPLTYSAIMSWASAVLFGIFFIVVSQRIWTTKELQMIINIVFLSSLLFALVLFMDNPDIMHSDLSTYRGVKVNPNPAAFTIAPGFLCGLFLSTFGHFRKPYSLIKELITILGTVFCFIIIIFLGGRSAFGASVLGGLLILWDKAGEQKSQRRRIRLRLLLIAFVIAVYMLGPILTEGTHAERLFDYENYTDTNGRDELFARAWELINMKPVFGGGFDYWVKESGMDLGTHNSILTIMVWGGYTAGAMIVLFFATFIAETLRMGSSVPAAFAVIAVFHTFTEVSMDYYAYIPMILAYIVTRYATFRRCKVQDIFIE